MNMNLRNFNDSNADIAAVKVYALKILHDHGCDEYSYSTSDGETVIRDLKEAYPEGMEYPYVDVANAILSISRPKFIDRAPYQMVWSNEHATDGVDFDSLGAAKCVAEDTLIEWMMEARNEWKDFFDPTDEELDDYNMMIDSCYVEVCEYDPMTDEYTEIDGVITSEDEQEIGWYELTREMIAQEKADFDKMEGEHDHERTL